MCKGCLIKAALAEVKLMRNFVRKYNLASMVTGGCICAVFALTVRIFSADPHYIWHTLDMRCSLPPMWIVFAFWLLANFLSGAVVGCILRGAFRCGGDCREYKGGIYLVLSMTAGLMWYPLLFGGRAFFISLVAVAVACFFASLCGIMLWRCDTVLSLVSLAVSVWYLTVFFKQLGVIFCI
jgi:tryptophan-rich sensory protein